MRIFLLSCFLLFSQYLMAQRLRGVVKDAVTRSPIENAQVITLKRTVYSDASGKFEIRGIDSGGPLSIRAMGYQTMELLISKHMLSDTLVVYLQRGSFQLNEVAILGIRNHRKDSVSLREEYAKVFAYRQPELTDMFIKVDPSYRSPFANSNPYSTASILKFNVLSALSVFKKKERSISKFKSTLIRDEQIKYVDQFFSVEKVRQVTGLEGDELADFMNTYRPNIDDMKKMTGYELVRYIKKCFAEFNK